MATPLVERPLPGPLTATDSGTRMVALRANLLPDEIVSARAADRMRRKALIALAAVVTLLVLWFGLSWWQTSSAEDELATLQQDATAMQGRAAQYAPLVRAQNETNTINERLRNLMTGDLSWKAMLTTLRAQAPAGVELWQVSSKLTAAAGVTDNSGTAGNYDALSGSTAAPIGSMTISGSAPTRAAIAGYADRLSKVRGLSVPVITGFTVRKNDVTFELSANLTTAALGGRYAAPVSPATGTPGGK